MDKSPEILAQSVNDRKSFLAFLEALASDWQASSEAEAHSPSSPFGAAARGWENVTLGKFLEAAHAWAEAAPPQFPASASWQSFAQLLVAGKVYE